MYFNIPLEREDVRIRDPTNRHNRQTTKVDEGNMPPKGFKLVAFAFDTMLTISNTQSSSFWCIWLLTWYQGQQDDISRVGTSGNKSRFQQVVGRHQSHTTFPDLETGNTAINQVAVTWKCSNREKEDDALAIYSCGHRTHALIPYYVT